MRTALRFTFLLSFLLTQIASAQSNIPSFVLNNRVGIQVGEPEDLAIDSQGNIYFVNGTVKKFYYHEFLGIEDLSYAPDGLNRENYGTFDIALDQHDNLFVVSYTYSKVAKFSPEGKLMLEFGTEGNAPGQFSFPEGIAVNSKDEIYVADSGNRRLQRFDKTGKLLQTIPLDPTTGNYFDAPLSIDFDGDDNLYLLHNPENKVVKYSPAGVKLLEFGNESSDTTKLDNPWKLAVDKTTGRVYVSDENLKTVNSYTLDGSVLYSLKWVRDYQHRQGYKNSIAITPHGDIVLANRGTNGRGDISLYDGGFTGHYTWGNLWQNVDLTIDEAGDVYLLDVSGTITRFNAWGEFVMNYGEEGSWRAGLPNLVIKAPKAITTDLFGNLYVLRNPAQAKDTTAIYKLDPKGNILSIVTEIGPNTETSTYTDLAVDAAGNMYVADLYGGLIHKVSPGGKNSGIIGRPGYGPGELWMPVALAIDKVGVLHVLDYNGGRIQQFDPRGNFIRQFGKFSKQDSTFDSNSDIALDGKGNIHVASNLSQRRYWVFSPTGDLLHEVLDNKVNHIAVNQLGTNLILDDDQADGYSLYNASVDDNPQSIIKGVVYNDANNNCLFDQGERPLSGIVVATSPGPYYAITDENGSYTLNVTPADYTLHAILPQQEGRIITATCPLPEKGHRITITNPGQLVQNINFGNYVYAPAHLVVNVNSTRRRRCFESTTIVKYSNTGFSDAPDAKVYLQLPPEVALLSADKTYTRLPNGTYEFSVGNLAAGQHGTITIQDIVTCGDESVRGRTVCTRAWITPSNNAPSQPTPTVTITGRCNAETGMIRFVIRNSGTADMEEHELFRKYANGELASIEQFRLAAGDSMVLWVPSMGYTWRLEADQPDGNGDNKVASVTMEGCTDATSGTTMSSGLVNLLPTDDEEAEVSEECLLITDSFDPNDKLVTPVGRTEENYTPTNTALKYKIRFQNTGTDVAYRVVVVDTLSEHLDLSTLEVGAASHNHTFEVSGKGQPVLTWTFHNIMLPDSTTNEPGSHGYIQFSIKPKADLPEKTAVENFADIFFDYNSPVRTNTTVNRIYDMPPVVNEAVRVNLEDVLATPTIVAFEPAAGKFDTEITITGKRFAPTATDNKVYLNGKAATVVSATDTELRVLVPAGSSTGSLKVITPDGGVTATEAFEVYQPPVVSSFSPVEGMVSNIVNLHGQHLGPELIEAVKLGNLNCEIVHHSNQTVSVKIPARAVTGAFSIITKGGEVQSASSYTVWYQPTISSLSTESGIVGSTFTITGENFTADKAKINVFFGLVKAQVLEASPQHLVVQVPEQAEFNVLVVETPGGPAFARFEVIPGPRFTAMQPAQGSVGTVVEISGQHFGVMGQQDKIAFNGQEALVLEASGDKYKVRVPRGATTGKVQITGYGGKAYSTADFVVEELTIAEAVIISPNPSHGSFELDLHRADFDLRQLQVFSSLGQLVLEQRFTAPRPDKLQVQLPKSQAGIYLLHLHTDRGLFTYKLFVH